MRRRKPSASTSSTVEGSFTHDPFLTNLYRVTKRHALFYFKLTLLCVNRTGAQCHTETTTEADAPSVVVAPSDATTTEGASACDVANWAVYYVRFVTLYPATE